MTGKLDALKIYLKKLGRVLVAYSGGADSTFLLKVAVETLGAKNVFAVIAESKTYPAAEKKFALSVAKKIGVNCRVVKTRELADQRFRENTPRRCFFCKDELFGRLKRIADSKKLKLIDGSNYSDSSDYRPGRIAAKKWGVVSPLKIAKITKSEVRRFSKSMGLITHDKPAQACLASRFAYGETISTAKLNAVEKAEEFLRKYGFGNIRVRISGPTARIEVDRNRIKKITEKKIADAVIRYFKKLGFIYVTVDLEGYRTGSQNLVFSGAERRFRRSA